MLPHPLDGTNNGDGDGGRSGNATPDIAVFEMTGAAMRFEADAHRHKGGQVLLPMDATLLCGNDRGIWLVPPSCAIWIPHGVERVVSAIGVAAGYIVLIAPALTAELPETCCTVAVTPSLRALVAERMRMSLPGDARASRDLDHRLLAELAAARRENLHLPMPTRPRLRRIVEPMMMNPAVRLSREDIAAREGMQGRSLDRGLLKETGMGFGRWRQQLAVILALRMMAHGKSIPSVAAELGYDSVGGFTKMFRKILGETPRRYMRAISEND